MLVKLVSAALIAFAGIRREILELIVLSFPFFGICRRGSFVRYIWPDFRVISVEREPLLGSRFGVRLDRFNRTFRLAYPTIDAFVGMNDEHVFAFVKAINGAHLDAIHT